MDTLGICFMLIALIVIILILCWSFYKYFVKPKESILLVEATFIISLSTSFILVLFIPVDIYLTSSGNFEISNYAVTQSIISKIYNFIYWSLVFQAYVVLPFSYFYFKNQSNYHNEFDDDVVPFENAIEALKNTLYFIFFVAIAAVIGLMYRPGHKPSMEPGKELEYISDLLDMKHTGHSAILFLMGCMVLIGISFWVSYTSYGLACLPLFFLQQKNIDNEKKEIENWFTTLKEREGELQNKFRTRGELKTKEKAEIKKIEQMKHVLSKYNYKLQELEKTSESWFSYILGIVFTFRVLMGIIFLLFSFTIYVSLFASIVDKYLNSTCKYSCGFVLEQINTIFNLLDSLLILFSKFFPLDILAIGSLAIYIFCCSLYGIVNVGIRVFFIPIYKIKKKNSSPETLLIICFIVIHIILVLIMTLLTIAPNYVTYGVQRIKSDDNLSYMKCSLKETGQICRMSVLSVFFNKIFFGIPYFSNSYFFSNWMFFFMFTCNFFYNLLFKKHRSYLDKLEDTEFVKQNLEEHKNLLPLEALT